MDGAVVSHRKRIVVRWLGRGRLRPGKRYSVWTIRGPALREIFELKRGGGLSGFFDPGCFPFEFSQVVKLCTPGFALAHDFDILNHL